MIIGLNSHLLKTGTESLCSFLTCIMCNYNTTNHESAVLELISKAQNILIVSDSEITTNLVLFNIYCADYNYDFRYVGQLHEHS